MILLIKEFGVFALVGVDMPGNVNEDYCRNN